jgi:hypothetical protein
MKKHQLQQFLSAAEVAFVDEKTPSEESRVAFSWRAEAMVSLLWALNGLPEMPPLMMQFEVFGVEMVKSALKDPHIEELNHGIVYERRYGLSWLVGWGEDWDNVPTDT